MITTAREFQNYCLAGLTMAGQNEHGEMEWIGKQKNWVVLGWLQDGVYEAFPDGGRDLIAQYLNL